MSLLPILIILLTTLVIACAFVTHTTATATAEPRPVEHFDGGAGTIAADTIQVVPESRAAPAQPAAAPPPPPPPDRFHEEPDRSVLAEYGLEYVPPTVWSTPQYRAPVCHQRTSCRDCPGTATAQFATLQEAAHGTSVGSIMPRFEFRESEG